MAAGEWGLEMAELIYQDEYYKIMGTCFEVYRERADSEFAGIVRRSVSGD